MNMAACSLWPLFGHTRTFNAAAYCASMSTVWAGQQWNVQVPGTRDTVYGSEGWGFESLRARPAQRSICDLTAAVTAAKTAA